MDPEGVSSFGTFFQLGDAEDPPVYTTIANVRDISGPGLELGTEDITNHSSAGWGRVIGTIKRGGEVTYDLNFTGDATHDDLYAVFTSAVTAPFRILFPTERNDECTFDALLTGWEIGAPVEGVLSASVTVTIDGPVVWDHD